MYKICSVILSIVLCLQSTAQVSTKTVIIRMPIAIQSQKPPNEVEVAVFLQEMSNITIKENTVGVLHKSYTNDSKNIDSSFGWGKCTKIAYGQHYFTIKVIGDALPQHNDILTFKAEVPICYEGLLFAASNNGIAFWTVDEKDFYHIETPYLLHNAKEEEKYLDHMVSDIKYTATEMLKQMPEMNKPLQEGIYKGVPLFTAMQKTTKANLQSFLKYIQARPKKYACSTWKISEIYATWLDGGSPQVIEE